MRRGVRLEEISDGRLYELNDMVKVGCNDCEGCFACCTGMGSSVVVDPLDSYRLGACFGQSFEELLSDKLALSIEGGLILPHVKMDERERCVFLNEAGRCTIHESRPGLCRIFPLGRYYEEDKIRYVLQLWECKRENRTKEKVKKWIATPNLKQNERFLLDWHALLVRMEEKAAAITEETEKKKLLMYLLELFYAKPYDLTKDFYPQFEERLGTARQWET